jgi:hypothetical protein
LLQQDGETSIDQIFLTGLLQLFCYDIPPEKKLLAIEREHLLGVSMKSRMGIIDFLGLGAQESVDTGNGFLQDESRCGCWSKIEFIAEVKKGPPCLPSEEPMVMEKTKVMGGMSRSRDDLEVFPLKLVASK